MGVTECDNMLMLLGVSTKMTEKERDVVVPLIMRGFKDSALEAGTTVTGGQTVVNPWCTIGGVASTVCQPNEYIVYASYREFCYTAPQIHLFFNSNEFFFIQTG